MISLHYKRAFILVQQKISLSWGLQVCLCMCECLCVYVCRSVCGCVVWVSGAGHLLKNVTLTFLVWLWIPYHCRFQTLLITGAVGLRDLK